MAAVAYSKVPEADRKVQISVSMAPSLIKRLAAIAKREGRTRSNIIEQAVRQCIEEKRAA